MISNRPDPTEAELEILQILWLYGASTVRFVNDTLQSKREVGYTTTLKMMQLMAQKNMLTRVEEGRGHVYQPLIARDQVQSSLVNKLVQAAFAGSTMNLVLQALGSHQPSDLEIEQLRQFLDGIERGEA
ncbi:MAG TPA: transcriptional regulator [Desulfobacter sp.]|nr:transcriptional regulator [Desulfobacter sp.]